MLASDLTSMVLNSRFSSVFLLLINTSGSFRTPVGLEDVSKYPKLIEYLISQGNWTDNDIIKLVGGNILRVIDDNEKVLSLIAFPFDLFPWFLLDCT